MARADHQLVLDLLTQARLGQLTRRQVLHRGLALGLSSPLIMSLLAACGGDDDETEEDPTEEPGAADQPTSTPVPVVRGDDATPTEAAADETETDESTESPTTETEDPTPTTADEERNVSDNRTFTTTLPGGVSDLDPHSAYDERASLIFFGTYEMLLQLHDESTFEYEPMLATAWEANDDLTEYTFTLREGAVFHDGTPCDADAVKYSFTRFHQMGLGPVDVIARFVEDPESQIEVVDETTVKFTMSKPEPLFLAAMASQYGPFVVSPTAVEENQTDDDPWAHDWLLQNVVGTGPYIATEIAPEERFVLERFEDYNGPEHFFDEIFVRVVEEPVTRRQLVENGEADGDVSPTVDDRIALKENPDVQVIDYESTQTNWMLLNYETLSRDAREGLCWAFPYDDVITDILRNYAKQQGPIADTVIGFDPGIELYTTDLDRARELLEQEGLIGAELQYTYQTGDTNAIALLFQANLAEIGVTLNLQEISPSAMTTMLFGDQPVSEKADIISWGWWPDYNDSYNQLYPNFHSESIGSAGANALGYANPEVDELLTQAGEATTEEELIDLTSQILQIMIWEDPAAIFYSQVIRSTVLRRDIRGFVPNGIYIATYNFSDMWREA